MEKKPNTKTTLPLSQPMSWLVCYSNSGDISILDDLEAKKAEGQSTGILNSFVPMEVTRLVVAGKPALRRRLIAGNYIFLKATKEDILRLRQEPPFDATLRFLHPTGDPTGCIYVADDEVEMMRRVVERMGGEVEYFAPSSKELMISDEVCILEGKFAGIRGFLESVKGHEGGCVIVPLGDILAVRTPRIPVDDIQLLSLAKVSDSQLGSYTSRAYKKVRVLTGVSEKLLEEKEAWGRLSEESEREAHRLVMRFSQLKLSGKIRLMHAQAVYNILMALGETESELFSRFRNMLP